HYLYRGYLQIAALDLAITGAPALWYTLWAPTESIATRPLSIRKNGTWYTFGHDLTKNITELYKTDGTLEAAYDYTPYGAVTQQGTDNQPFQWSSEVYDADLGMVYYNYRHYNPMDGRWINRDLISEQDGYNLYDFVGNNCFKGNDYLGLLFNQRQDLCCQKCNEKLEEKKKIYASEIKEIEDKGCSLTFICKNLSFLGGTRRTDNRLNPFSKISIKITIDCKTGANQSIDSPEDTFGHELVHARDHCFGKIGSSCESIICTEIRAYSIGGCKGLNGANLIECLKRRVPASANKSCWFKNAQEISNMIESMYAKCTK
ncbi:MAG: RHS repeat-associated core domain-containing protein, partial [Akkermansia sp.]